MTDTENLNYFSLTLKQQPNILDGITLYEPIDTAILEKLVGFIVFGCLQFLI